MSKKIIVIITVLSIVLTMVFLPVFSSAATVPSNYKQYNLTSADLMYLYREGYLELTYTIEGSSLTTELTQWRFTSTAFGNHNIFYTPIYRTAGTYKLTFDLKLPFDFVFRSWLYYHPNIYQSTGGTGYDRSSKGLLNGSVVYSGVGDTFISSLNYGVEIWGVELDTLRSVRFNPYNYSSGSSVYSPIDEFYFSYTSSTSKAGAYVDFGSSFAIMVSPDTFSRLEGQTGFGTASGVVGEPSWGDDPITPDIGGDSPSGGGEVGGTDLTPLISYLMSLSDEDQSAVDSLDSELSSSSSELDSSLSGAVDSFDTSEALKSELIGDVDDASDFIDSIDLDDLSISYDDVDFTFNLSNTLPLLGSQIQSVLSFPLFYFMIFLVFALSFASFILYGRL